LNGQILGSESDYFNSAMPSAKALGKRTSRAISPMSILATVTPHFPPYSANIQSHRLPSSSLTHNHPYGLLNNNFNDLIDDPISSAMQSSSVEANGADSIRMIHFTT
jgi:hypothetical protein